MDNQSKGKKGEALAERHLLREGYRILHRRFRCKWGENDLIAEKDDLLCFVEVKARNSTRYGSGADAVTQSKIRSATRAAQQYLQQHPHRGPIRFDVIEVDLHTECVRHIPAAFDAVE